MNPASIRAAATPALVLLLCLATATPAHAAPKGGRRAAATEDTAEALALQARERFLAKDFPAAARLFMKAYARDPDPALVFNAARAYQEGGMKGDAAGLFRLYVSISQDADGIANAHQRLRALEGKPSVLEGAAAAGLADGASQTAAGGVQARAPEPTWPRWAVTGAAAVGLASGVALMVLARGDSLDAAALPVGTDAEIATYDSRFDAAERKWTAGVAVAAVGAGLGVWATWLHLDAGPKRAAWRVEVGPRSVRLAGNF